MTSYVTWQKRREAAGYQPGPIRFKVHYPERCCGRCEHSERPKNGEYLKCHAHKLRAGRNGVCPSFQAKPPVNFEGLLQWAHTLKPVNESTSSSTTSSQ